MNQWTDLHLFTLAMVPGLMKNLSPVAMMNGGHRMMGDGMFWMILLCILGLIIAVLLIILLILLIVYVIKKIKE